jgi:membrane-bound metal-dependent hydrolase YbcI (DUF457 family)
MFFFTHLAAGLIIGELTGNYWAALIGALVIDLDHLLPFFRKGILLKPKELWKAITSPEDHIGKQRNIMHSILTWLILSAIAFLIDTHAGIAFSLGYKSHLLLDAMDNYGLPIFFPHNFKISGPIKYLSTYEYVLATVLFIVFLALH